MSFLILLTSLRDLVTYANFYHNQDYIAQNLCVNRFDAVLMCNGKCYLKDSLSENHESEDSKLPVLPEEERAIYIIPIITSLLNPFTSHQLKKDSIAYKSSVYVFEYLDEVFHPPIVFA